MVPTGSPPEALTPTVLDLRNLRCPLPVLRTRKALRALGPDAVLVVYCTDPLSGVDIPHLLSQTGDALLDTERDGAVLTFTIRKRGRGDRPEQDPPACSH